MSNAALRCTRPPPPRAPRRPLPEGACDSHAHVFGPSDRYPYATGTQYRPADRAYFPPDVTVDDYVALLAALGVRHAVLVQPNIYGSDHRCLLNALARFNGGARGIGVVSMTASDEELRALHQAGLRGVRFHGVGAHHMDALRDFSARLSAMTWHIQIYASLDWIAAHAAPLATLACPVVFDHFAGLQLDAPGVERDFQTLLRLVAEGPVWVKLSAPFRVMPRSPPYHALAGRARALADAAPHRLLWGSDWPYLRVAAPLPDGGDLLDALAEWLPHSDHLRAVLCDNPRTLYGLDDSESDGCAHQ